MPGNYDKPSDLPGVPHNSLVPPGAPESVPENYENLATFVGRSVL